MNRRAFLAAGTSALLPLRGAESKQMIIEIQKISLRNTTDSMLQRTTDYLGKALVPALQRMGAAHVGVFQSLIAPDTPFLITVVQYPNAGAWEGSTEKLSGDKELAKARESYYSGPLQFVRSETTLLRGFPSFPGLEVPSALPNGRSRIYELRTYASNNPATLARKIRMFDEGEIAIFRKVGMAPVFFGQTIAGENMPNLTYMVGFDDLAARERIWGAFGSSPDWQKLRSQPGLADPEIVSNISNIIIRPLPFSGIK